MSADLRSILGSMTEFAFMIAAYTKGELTTDGALAELAEWLGQTPCSPLGTVRAIVAAPVRRWPRTAPRAHFG